MQQRAMQSITMQGGVLACMLVLLQYHTNAVLSYTVLCYALPCHAVHALTSWYQYCQLSHSDVASISHTSHCVTSRGMPHHSTKGSGVALCSAGCHSRCLHAAVALAGASRRQLHARPSPSSQVQVSPSRGGPLLQQTWHLFSGTSGLMYLKSLLAWQHSVPSLSTLLMLRPALL